jgi:hypothetical protein
VQFTLPEDEDFEDTGEVDWEKKQDGIMWVL